MSLPSDMVIGVVVAVIVLVIGTYLADLPKLCHGCRSRRHSNSGLEPVASGQRRAGTRLDAPNHQASAGREIDGYGEHTGIMAWALP
jgi:hypothetical protein